MTTSRALVVPTKGDRPFLPSIIDNADCPVFVIATRPGVEAPGAAVIEDLGPVNIQRWWNRGIDAAGADHVAIFNDDITYPGGLIQEMSARLEATGAAVCFTGTHSADPVMTGWAFMIDARQVRPDERFRWYYGDNDIRAQELTKGGLTCVATRVTHHHPGESTRRDEELQRLAEADCAAFNRKWS